ncbi:unnamed protein product [marine sediment metagenome]|uniref:Uncharacterized protein n=1 Tax=marine sediment metagenome TaxID=412755 RepID=X1LFG5_9ZZZZ
MGIMSVHGLPGMGGARIIYIEAELIIFKQFVTEFNASLICLFQYMA